MPGVALGPLSPECSRSTPQQRGAGREDRAAVLSGVLLRGPGAGLSAEEVKAMQDGAETAVCRGF